MTLILIDCENFSHNCAGEIFADYEVGPNVHAHGFCDFTISQSWTRELFLKFNITAHQVFHANRYKNAADMALARFAMEHIAKGCYTELVIASSDSDFTDLMLYAKSQGLRVICYASNSLLNPNIKLACTKLRTCVPKAAKAEDGPKKPNTQSKAQKNAALIKKIIDEDFAGAADVLNLARVLKKRDIIAKNKKGAALKTDLLAAGLFVENGLVFTSQERAKEGSNAQKQAQNGEISAQPPGGQMAVRGNFSSSKEKPAPQKNAKSKFSPLRIFYEEIFSHYCELEKFAKCLNEHGYFLPQESAIKWLNQKGLEIFCSENSYKIYPQKIIKNENLSKEFCEQIKEKIYEKFQNAKNQFESELEKFINFKTDEICKNYKSGFLDKLKNIFGFKIEQKIRKNLRKTLEKFYELSSEKSCLAADLKGFLIAEKICVESEFENWLNECDLKISSSENGEIIFSNSLPNAICEKMFFDEFEAKILISKMQKISENHFDEINKILQFACVKICENEKIKNEENSQNDENSSEQNLQNLEKITKSDFKNLNEIENSEKVDSNAAAKNRKNSQSIQMLQNFAPAARMIFLRKLHEIGNESKAVSEYFRSLNLAVLKDFSEQDLGFLGLNCEQNCDANEKNSLEKEKNFIAASAQEFAESLFYELRAREADLPSRVLNAYASTLSAHKGDLDEFAAELKAQGLLPEFYSRAASAEFLKLFGFELALNGEKLSEKLSEKSAEKTAEDNDAGETNEAKNYDAGEKNEAEKITENCAENPAKSTENPAKSAENHAEKTPQIFANSRLKIIPASSTASDFEGEIPSANSALKSYSKALENSAQIDVLQRAALFVCLAGEAASVKADFLLANCLLKRFKAPQISPNFALADAFLQLAALCVANERGKIECQKAIGAAQLAQIFEHKLAFCEQFCAEQAVFLCCEYQAGGALNSEAASEYFAAFYAQHPERANAERAALCAVFDEHASDHGGSFVSFISLPQVQEILGAGSARIKKLHLQALDFALSEGRSQLIAKPGEQPVPLAPSKERLDALAASAMAAVAGLFSAPEAEQEKPADVAADVAAEKPAEEEKAAAAENPAADEKSAEKPAEKPAEEEKPAEKPAADEKSAEKPAENPAEGEAKKPRKRLVRPDAQTVAKNVANVQKIKYELGQVDAAGLIAELRARKIRPLDLACPNWSTAFKKYAIFDD